MTNFDEIQNDLEQRIRIRAEETKNFTRAAMAELYGELLEEAGEIEEFVPAYFEGHGQRVDGYGLSRESDAIDLFIADFQNGNSNSRLIGTDIKREFKRLKTFFNAATSKDLFKSMEESSPAYGLSWTLRQSAKEFGKLRLFLFSGRLLSDRIDAIPNEKINGWSVSHHIWDVGRIARIQEDGRDPISINFKEEFGEELLCLPAHMETGEYKSYLIVIPGPLLAKLYENYGARLLELNVRTFLQVRGNVNKGIRGTILNEPQMFFAYNNGISATADEVETIGSNGTERIQCIKNLQIVNGGQTTASLYHAGKSSKANLRDIFVQMKLSVVNSEHADRIIPKISEYANTQNKVSAADFFSNHQFHVRVEDMSRTVWAPAVGGSQRQSKWYYERVRGQYAEAQSKMSKSEKNIFQKEYPKHQLFCKTDLAKFDNVWDGYPVEVNLGAQKNFAQYAKRISDAWDVNSDVFDERYYRQVIARCIFFKATEKLVTQQKWYNGGYRANIVAYTQALLAENAKRLGVSVDWETIWVNQELSEGMLKAITTFAKSVNDFITKTPENIRNVTEWCKKKACWEGLKDIQISIPIDAYREMINVNESDRRSKRRESSDRRIDAQKIVLKQGADYWTKVRAFCIRNKVELSVKEKAILELAMSIPERMPSELQCVALIDLVKRAKVEGAKNRMVTTVSQKSKI